MTLDNETLLGSFLAQLQSNVRGLAALDFERTQHPDYTGHTESAMRREMREAWETLTRELWDLLELPLKPFSTLAEPGSYHTNITDDVCCLRWNFGKLKKMADKHRLKHEKFVFLKSWDYEAKKRLTAEQKADLEIAAHRRSRGWA